MSLDRRQIVIPIQATWRGFLKQPRRWTARGGRPHLVAALNELDGHLLPGGLVQRQLHKPEGAAVEIPDLQP